MKIQASCAALPGVRHADAVQQLHELPLQEPLWGQIQTNYVQLVPQSFGLLDVSLGSQLADRYPGTQFRLHANVRVSRAFVINDLSNFQASKTWFKEVVKVHQAVRADVYTAHAGRRDQATMRELFDNARAAADLFGCRVGIEGLYPTRGDPWLVSTWDEYRALFESGLDYVLDLSHINIVARKQRSFDVELLRDMLASEHCLEVHVSDNDGSGDQHRICQSAPWWSELLPSVHNACVVFTEGNHKRKNHEI